MKYIIGFYLIIFSLSFAINPTDSGDFPPGFWEEMGRQHIGMEYGDPGWKKKISDWKNNSNRGAQLEFNIPVLLGKYSDTETTYFDEIDFQNLLFDNNPTGSMKEYYEEISYGNFLVDGNSDGWYQSTYSIAQAKINTRQFIADIAQLADPDFDYSLYDNDGPDNVPNSGDDDGYVDGIMVVYAGCGAEWGSGNDNLWPHMSTLGDYEYTTNDMAEDGSSIIINTYAVSPELAGGGDCYTDIIRPMGVYAHEFGHILGLPDLYDRDDEGGEQSEGLGEWCLMASGSWLGWGGDKPAHMSAWCKLEMGWIDPVILSTNYNDLEIPQIETNPYVLKIWEDDYYWNRYFLVENRQKEGFDSDLNGSGIIIYHIDENQRYGSHSFSSGPVNNDETHKFIDIEEADGFSDLDNQINRGDDGDSFPGSSNNIAFDDNSNPNSSRYDGTETGISVTNISSSYEFMTADISIRQQYGYTIAYDELGINWSWGWSNPQNTWGGVLFTSPSSGLLTEVDVGIHWGTEYHNFEVLVYDSFDGESPGTLLESIPSYADESKWYSVPIDSIEVTDGEDFFIALKINESFAIPIDGFGEKSNRSYYSGNGSDYSNSISNYGDINIRAKITTCTETEKDVCGVCGGNGWDACDEDGDGTLNYDQWGYGAYGLSAIDIPNDQGGYVYLSFTKSFYDTDTLTTVVPEDWEDSGNEGYLIERLDNGVWTSILSIFAYGSDSYQVEARTLVDSTTSSTNALAEYRVIAAMMEGNFVSNETATGYSIDNIAPQVPQSFSTVADYSTGVAVQLSWSEPVDDDFSYFSIYKNSELLITTISNNYSDADVTYGSSLTYYVTSMDVHENESSPSASVSVQTLVSGCTNVDACNYNAEAGIDDGSCTSSEDLGCGCNLPASLSYCIDTDGDGQGAGDTVDYCLADLPDSWVEVCTDPEPDCPTNDTDECGECAGYNSTCTGCMNDAACNYNDCNGDEVLDDPCTIEDNELCSYPEEVYLKCDGSCINDSNEDGICDELSLFGGAIPEEYNIHSIYPNPFNPITNIIYGLPEYSRVHIIIYDISGRPVISLVNEYQTPGYYSTVWNADSYPSGIYFVNIIAGEYVNTQKLMLVK